MQFAPSQLQVGKELENPPHRVCANHSNAGVTGFWLNEPGREDCRGALKYRSAQWHGLYEGYGEREPPGRAEISTDVIKAFALKFPPAGKMSVMGMLRQPSDVLLRYAHTPMQVTIHVPDDLFDEVKDKLASQPSGVLETVALDAILGFLYLLRDGDSSSQRAE
jgi:hypothetical protein